MDDPNMTMEEYIKLEEEKARRCGQVFNWQTATYGKIKINDGLHDLSSMEAEFLAIVINDAFAPQDALQCKSHVSTFNDEIDFRISFDKSDDEDYTIICDKISFSYKMIYVNDLKTDSENDNEKVMPSPEPTTSYIDDLDFFNDFESEFPAIVYNDAQMSKSDFLTELTLNPQHIDEFNLNDETSMSKYDEEEQNILYFNDLFPFNIICPDDLKSEKDNDDNDIDIMQSFEDMAFPSREQRHRFLRYKGLEYSDVDITDFEARLARIYRREVHRVLVFDFGGLPDLMAEGLSARMLMEHWDDQGVSLFTSGPGGGFLILEALSVGWSQEAYELERADNARHIPDKEDLRDYWLGISSARDFLGITPSYTMIRDPILRLCHRLIACSIAGRYLRFFTVRRKSEAHISRRQFVARLAEHFGLLTTEILGGLTVIALELPIIDMAELVRLQICAQFDDTWAWVAIGPKRQPDVAAGASTVAEDAPAIDEGNQAILAPVQAPQQPPPPPPAARIVPQ
ncbi:hypothetical protein Tco_0991046 [Tanacetum coccineum]|uniref:Uncharacterized protein n=1 Tax=Tanacetum coccineum TaxID=301880 RepID=A0ABQ5EZV3_9ASTR